MDKPVSNAVEQDTIKAIGLMILAVGRLSAMDLAIKQLVEYYPSMQVVFLRSITSAAAVGFVGVLVVLQPGMNSQLISYGSMMALVTVVDYSFMALLLRHMGQHDSTVAISFWFIALVGLGAGLLSMLDWAPVQWQHWPWFALLCINGSTLTNPATSDHTS